MDETITLYSQPGCPQCRTIHMILDKNNLKYNECQDMNIMQEKGIKHTPAIEVVSLTTDENGNITDTSSILYGRDIINYVNGVK